MSVSIGLLPMGCAPSTMNHTPDIARSASPERPAGLLAEITADLSAGADIRALLQRFIEPIVQLAQAGGGAVRMLGDDNRLHLVGQFGLPPTLACTGRSVARQCGGCGQAVDDDHLAWDHGLSTCTHATRETLAPIGWAHMLAVPLAHQGRVLGVYNLFFDPLHQPSEAVRSVLRSVGELLGLALNNARLEAANLRAMVVQERQMMAADVHDAVAQDLAFLRMRLPLLEQAIDEQDAVRATGYLADLRDALGHAHGSLREIVNDLRTPPDPQGLGHALKTRVDEFAARSGIGVTVVNQLPSLVLPSSHEAHLLHILGEALSNIARHAQARQVTVSLGTHAGRIELLIEDDGMGIAAHRPAPGSGHHGLAIMAERATRIGGVLTVRARDGGGTAIALSLAEPARPLDLRGMAA